MSMNRDELREELLAVLQARQELSHTEEQHLVEMFLRRLDIEIDARIDRRVGDRLAGMPAPRRTRSPTAAVVLMLLIAIPLTAIAGAAAGIGGIAIVWFSILGLIYLVTR
jgi:hypothetical protein